MLAWYVIIYRVNWEGLSWFDTLWLFCQWKRVGVGLCLHLVLKPSSSKRALQRSIRMSPSRLGISSGQWLSPGVMCAPCSFALSKEWFPETVLFPKEAVSLGDSGQTSRSPAVLHSGVSLLQPGVCVRVKAALWNFWWHVVFPHCLCAVLICVRVSTDPAALKVSNLFSTATTNRSNWLQLVWLVLSLISTFLENRGENYWASY